jgi:hypothetical protein
MQRDEGLLADMTQAPIAYEITCASYMEPYNT